MSQRKGDTGTPLKILVVDDTPTNQLVLQVFLRKLGFTVVLADDGALGVAAFEREAPDIVLMDVMMPVMDGYEATRRIKALAGEHWVPVLFLSALDKDVSLVTGLEAGGDDYLAKPVNFVVLEAKLRSLGRALALQHSLDDERQRSAAIAENLVDGIVTIDEAGLIQTCNPALESIFGYSAEEMIGQNVGMLMPESQRGEHVDHVARYVKGGEPHIIGIGQRKMRGRRRDGEVFALDVGVSEMRVGGRRQFVGVLRDSSEREMAERLQQENAQRLEAYYETQEATTALAKKIVNSQLQRESLKDPSVAHWLAPAENFSGDIVAATRGLGGDLYVLLADATGHGLGAAICTLPVLSVFYSMAETGVKLPWIIQEVNRQLKASLQVGHFVAATMLCVAANGEHAQVWVGGMPALLLLDAAGQLKQRVISTSLPLGIDVGEPGAVTTQTLPTQVGDQFVIFSDGLPEAENEAGEPFGDLRLRAALATPADQRLDSIKQALARYMGGAVPHDDISLMLVTCRAAV